MHARRRERFAELKKLTQAAGYQLPTDFVTFIETDEYVTRLRHECEAICVPEFLCPCPLDPTLLMVLFQHEDQGWYTHLLLARDGDYCVTRSAYGYGYSPRVVGQLSEENQWICLLADSFAEHLVREADEICERDRYIQQRMVEHGDASREAGHRRTALDSYMIALCFDPGNELIQQRIAEMG
jgi:hypothetical protein